MSPYPKVVLVAAVVGIASVPRLHQQPTLFDSGFELLAAPTDGDPPGTVFRLDAQKRRYEVGQLGPRLPVSRSNVAVSTQIQRNVKVSLLARIIGVGAIDGNVASGYSTQLQLTDATKESTVDADVRPAINAMFSQQTMEPGMRYYVIRETISAKSISYGLRDSAVGALGGRAKVQQAMSARADLSWSSSTSNQVNQKFPKPYRVLYKVEEIRRPAGSLGGVNTIFSLVPIDTSFSVEAICDSSGKCR